LPPEFKPFASIPRLSRPVVITEKLDGTNAVIYVPEDPSEPIVPGSRSRWLVNGQDNHGFARWAYEHQNELRGLGPGYHYGEWWGQGIQRGYGLKEKRFSLFNVSRWATDRPACCHVVPVLGKYDIFNTMYVDLELLELREKGSVAAPGYMNPEGIVVFHEHSRHLYKKTIEKDEVPKSLAP
jgi:hypothetical protein